jgi:tRNA(Ile2) C34 agmatinyltransferase TiaS
MNYFIGVDDTDFGESIGTGALARELMLHLSAKVGVQSKGVTRHQFLIHPDIPYTTHNSSACVEVECEAGLDALADACRGFIGFLFHEGADPGLCITWADQLSEPLLSFGRRAQQEVVTKEEAIVLAREAGILLEEHGGDGIGIIGALSGCCLRMDGSDGRFISLVGIRDTAPAMTVAELCDRTPITAVVDETGRGLGDSDVVQTNNWVRPDLVDKKIVLKVRSNKETGGYFIKKVPKVKAV